MTQTAESKKEPEKKAVEKPVKPSPRMIAKHQEMGGKEVKPVKTDLEPGLHYDKGYVSEAGILFPKGFKFKGGSVSWKGNVVLNQCPKCKTEMSPGDAVKGKCTNEECGFDMVEELENFKL